MSKTMMMELIEVFEKATTDLRNMQTTMILIDKAVKIDHDMITDTDKQVVLRKIYHTVSSSCAEAMGMMIAPYVIVDTDGAVNLVNIHMSEMGDRSLHWAREIAKQNPAETLRALKSKKPSKESSRDLT